MAAAEFVLANYALFGVARAEVAADLPASPWEIGWGENLEDRAGIWLARAPGALLGHDTERVRGVIERSRRHAGASFAPCIGVGFEAESLHVLYGPRPAELPLSAPAGAVEPHRVLGLLHALAGALSTLHEQGLGHGCLSGELIGQDDRGVVIGGLGLFELWRTAAVGAQDPVQRDLRALDVLCARLFPDATIPAANSADVRTRARELEAAVIAALAPAPQAAPAVGSPPPLPAAPSASQIPPPPGSAALLPEPAVPDPPAADGTTTRSTPQGDGSRGVLWASVPIVLGALTLLGGVAAVALRAPPSGPGGGAVASPGPMVVPAPALPPVAAPKLAAPQPDKPVPRDPVPSPAGVRALAEEASALLPVNADRPIWGTADAGVTLTLFGDLECEHTRAALRDVQRLQAELGRELRIVFHHALFGERPTAVAAARALARVTATADPDAAFRFLAAASQSSQAAEQEEIERWLASAASSSKSAVDERGIERILAEDAELAALLAVRVTPTLFVNGARVEGAGRRATVTGLLQTELRSVRWLRAQGASPATAYAERVRRNLINVHGAAADRACVPVAGAPVEGPNDALVTLVEFSDFECPHCRELHPVLVEAMRRHRGSMRRVWRSLAAPQHGAAKRLAGFAFGARASGGERAFWTMHDALFENEIAADDSGLLALAKGLGLDPELLLSAARDPGRDREIEGDRVLAQKLDLEGTPTVFLNGRRLSGAVPGPVLLGVVEEELAAARRIVQRGTPAAYFDQLLCGDVNPGGR